MNCGKPGLLGCIACALACLASAGVWALDGIPIVSARELGLQQSVPADVDFDRPFEAPLPARLTVAAGGQLIALNNCREYLAARERIVGSDSDADFRVLRLQSVPCLILALLKGAVAARLTALPNDFLQQLATGDYPASIWPAVADDERDFQLRPDATLATVSSQRVWRVTNDNTLEIKDHGMGVHLTLLARGDFDHDGWEDAAFLWEAYALNGSYSDARLVVLTRSGANDGFRELNWFELLGSH
jgi:hypothetical protein